MSCISRLKDRRLGIFADSFAENSFVLRTAEIVFARICKVGNKWIVWLYKKHLQKTFEKLRDALAFTNDEFAAWYRDKKV